MVSTTNILNLSAHIMGTPLTTRMPSKPRFCVVWLTGSDWARSRPCDDRNAAESLLAALRGKGFHTARVQGWNESLPN
jgi:hypothetical protein